MKRNKLLSAVLFAARLFSSLGGGPKEDAAGGRWLFRRPKSLRVLRRIQGVKYSAINELLALRGHTNAPRIRALVSLSASAASFGTSSANIRTRVMAWPVAHVPPAKSLGARARVRVLVSANRGAGGRTQIVMRPITDEEIYLALSAIA